MAKKYFFTQESELCHPKEYFRELADPETGTIDVFEAEMLTGTGFFFCQEFEVVGESGEGCGLGCAHYDPRNGKNGRCRSHKSPYETGKLTTLKFRITKEIQSDERI